MRKRILFGLILLVIIIGGSIVVWHHGTPPKSLSSAKSNSNQSSQTTKTGTPSDGFDKTKYSLTEPASPWVIVNKKHPLSPLNYAPSDLVAVGAGQYMRAEAAAALKTMLAGAATAGYSVTPASGYRSYTTQVSVYNNEVKSYGQATADSESARPGFSEHQTGLAMDLASGGCSITDCFGTTPGGQWIITNAYKYGFIQRYPADKVAITGYRNETWHFRYLGVPLATELHNQHIETLEEFFHITGGQNY